MATRPVLRIFISSTAVDLIDYREKVVEAVLRLESLPVAMETFSAMSGQPASECKRMAAEADAVVCVVAHRYGYVPPLELGGDGERSITWLEVDAAKRAGKPVFAFLVDSKAPWIAQKEQDRLTSEPPEKVPEIVRAVQKLQEFKAHLEKECTLQFFTNPHDLAGHVTAALANFNPHQSHAVARVWKPLICYALQPAQHFRGREALLSVLKDWLQTPVTPDRVLSVVAAGGAGKTALVNEALHQATLSDRAGVFVWSFYEDPHTDAFLREAYRYFTGEKDTPAGGMLERLQQALSGDVPHVLVLDGLERVQCDEGPRKRGELEDLQLKRFLRALAGGLGSARALVTSRFPLVDLDLFTGAGHRAIVLDDLDLPVAIAVLKAWKVRGDDAALVRAIEPLNMGGVYHALSVAVLGSYLGNFEHGDPTRAPQFSLADAKEADPRAARLFRILEQYRKALTRIELDLLARLSLFPRGVKVEILCWIVQSGREVAGALIGLADIQLTRHLEKLRNLGLVFRYETDGQVVYSAHPFLRDFFRNLLATKSEDVHESVRAKLALSLDARPSTAPSDPAILDQYELLIEQTLLAGRVQEAFDLYRDGLGNYDNLALSGENGRGLRILERFVPRDEFTGFELHLSVRERSYLVNDLGIYARILGDLDRARRAFTYSRQLYPESAKAINLADVEILAGRFKQALDYSERAVSLATEAKNRFHTTASLAYRAIARFALGDTTAAADDFRRATESEGQPLYSTRGIQEAECKLLRGDRSAALSESLASRATAARDKWSDDLCLSNALLARLLLPGSPGQAADHLQEARDFASRSGAVELQLRCFHAACELQLHLADYPQAIAEAEAGINLADTCGFGKFSIELRIVLAETLLAAGDFRKALQNARKALDLSLAPDCQYAWGQADGLHFCGAAHQRLGEIELARQRLTAALELRERLGHGRIEETRRELARLQ